MRVKIEIESAVRADVPPELQVGDEIDFEGIAIVAGMEAELVDVTSLGDAIPKVIPGERTVKLLLTLANVRTNA